MFSKKCLADADVQHGSEKKVGDFRHWGVIVVLHILCKFFFINMYVYTVYIYTACGLILVG